MSHRFYPGREDGNIVRAEVLGTIEFEPATGTVAGSCSRPTGDLRQGYARRRGAVRPLRLAQPRSRHQEPT